MTGVLLWAAGAFCQLHLALDQFQTPLGVMVGPGGGVVVIGTLLSDQIPILLSSAHRWC